MEPSLSTRYMGVDLRSPLVVSAGPLSRDAGMVDRLARAGAGAIVMFSLFEEQFAPEGSSGGSGESMRPDLYLEHIRRLKRTVDIPIIASLNASGPGGWLDYARSMEEAGADAIEVTLYHITADPTLSGVDVEDRYVRVVEHVRAAVSIPVALKLTPYFTNLSAVAARLDEAGANALVLFNRFYQPTIDIERSKVVVSLDLSSPAEARLPTMWIAMLKGQIRADLAASTGIHGVAEVVRAIMAGADVAMVCSVLLKYGPDRLADLHRGLSNWLGAHGHDNLDRVRASMRLARQAQPGDYTRRGYKKVLDKGW